MRRPHGGGSINVPDVPAVFRRKDDVHRRPRPDGRQAHASRVASGDLAARLPAPSGDGPLFQASKAFAKDGDRDRSDDRDDDRGGRSGSGGRDFDDRDDDRGGGGRGSDDDRSDSGRSSRDDSADRDRSSRDDSADRSRSARDEAEDRSESRGRGSTTIAMTITMTTGPTTAAGGAPATTGGAAAAPRRPARADPRPASALSRSSARPRASKCPIPTASGRRSRTAATR